MINKFKGEKIMKKQSMTGGKFGIEIPALTEARIQVEAESYSPQSRTAFHKAVQSSSDLIKEVETFLEENGAPLVSGCGTDMFGVITSQEDPAAPCGVSFYGTRSLAEAVARAFPDNRVISAKDGAAVKPTLQAATAQAATKRITRKPRA
jgi:hypothetical protein